MKVLPIIGVYCIKCKTSNKVYVGSSFNVEARLKIHKYMLRRGKGNQHFQNAWNKYSESDFEFSILEKLNDASTSKVQLEFREQWWMDRFLSYEYSKGFNIRRIATSNKGMRVSNTSNVRRGIIESKGKRCILYDSEGNFVKECETLDEASEFVTGKRQVSTTNYSYKNQRHVFHNFYLVPYTENYSKVFTPDPIKKVLIKEGKKKISETATKTFKGVKRSSQTHENMRQAKRKAQGVTILATNLETGEVIKFGSAPECMEFFNILCRSAFERIIKKQKTVQNKYILTKSKLNN